MENKTIKRPRSVTWLACLIMGFGSLSLLIGLMFVINQPTVMIINVLVIGFFVILGFYMFKGRNWARVTWMWAMLVYIILVEMVRQQTQVVAPGNQSESLLGDIFRAIWIGSLFVLNKTDVKSYFLQYTKSESKVDKEQFYEIDNKLVLSARKYMENKQTDELIEILKQNDSTQYTREAFEAINQILKDRGQTTD
jgi:hypothetical protein